MRANYLDVETQIVAVVRNKALQQAPRIVHGDVSTGTTNVPVALRPALAITELWLLQMHISATKQTLSWLPVGQGTGAKLVFQHCWLSETRGVRDIYSRELFMHHLAP